MPVPLERRTKAQQERREPQQANTSQDSLPPAPTQDKCSNKQITTGRKIDFSFLENEGFQIENKIRKMT